MKSKILTAIMIISGVLAVSGFSVIMTKSYYERKMDQQYEQVTQYLENMEESLAAAIKESFAFNIEETTVTIEETYVAETYEQVPAQLESIPAEDFANVEEIYSIDLGAPRAPMVPMAVYEYRLENPVSSGTIEVVDFEMTGDGITVRMLVNGESVEYYYEEEMP